MKRKILVSLVMLLLTICSAYAEDYVEGYFVDQGGCSSSIRIAGDRFKDTFFAQSFVPTVNTLGAVALRELETRVLSLALLFH